MSSQIAAANNAYGHALNMSIGNYMKKKNITAANLNGITDNSNISKTSFADFVNTGIDSLKNNLRATEQISSAAIVGQASTADLVTSIAEVETQLQTIKKINETLIASLNDIMKMPI